MFDFVFREERGCFAWKGVDRLHDEGGHMGMCWLEHIVHIHIIK